MVSSQRIVMFTSSSFVPAESATLGLVDKSGFWFFNADNGNSLTHDQFLPVFRHVNPSRRSSWTESVAPLLRAPDLALSSRNNPLS